MDKLRKESQPPLFPVDEYKKTHPLLREETREEGGVIQQFKTGYQKRLAVRKCLEMLSPDSKIVSVAIELHEDYVVEFKDGSFEFCQVKHKDEGQEATFGTLADPLYNLFCHFKNNPKAHNNFTIQTNREAHSSTQGPGNLYELKRLLSRKENYGLSPSEENRFMGLKSVVCNLKKFQTEDRRFVDQFIDKLIIKTDEDDVEAVKGNCRLLALEILKEVHNTPNINLNIAESFHTAIYLLVDQAGQEKDDRSKRIIYRAMAEKLIPARTNLAEYNNPVSDGEERNIYYDPDPQNTILENKCDGANLKDQVNNLKEVKIIARNRNDHYLGDPVAVSYISSLRKKIQNRYSLARLQLRTDGEAHRHDKVYLLTMEDLKQIARDEKDAAPVRLDFDYLHGLYAQLMSECIIHPAY